MMALRRFGPVRPVTILNVLLIATALSVGIAGFAHVGNQKESKRDVFADIRHTNLLLKPELAELSPTQTAIVLRDLIHNTVPHTVPKVTNWRRLSRDYRKALMDPDYGHICGGLSILYIAALKAHGIKSRKVSLYTQVVNVKPPVWSHASVEVFLNGRWVAMDPTYNFTIKTDNRPIGWIEAARLARTGIKVRLESNKQKVLPRYKSYNLDRPLSDPANFLNQFLAFINIGTKTEPATWDGVVHYLNGEQFDSVAADTSRLYRRLH